jgi:hypothetical protein
MDKTWVMVFRKDKGRETSRIPRAVLGGGYSPVTYDARSQVGKVGLPPLDRLCWLEEAVERGQAHLPVTERRDQTGVLISI